VAGFLSRKATMEEIDMSGMGPAPKRPEERRRRNATVAMTKLPAGGRQGDPPPWPLEEFGEYEASVWAELWRTPQAAAWDGMGVGVRRVVARYVRLVASPEPSEKTLPEIRQMEDRLGLNPLAMLRLRWEVTEDEVGERRQESRPASAKSSRNRFRVVDPNSASG
jgi:hypothetical protein